MKELLFLHNAKKFTFLILGVHDKYRADIRNYVVIPINPIILKNSSDIKAPVKISKIGSALL